MSDGDRKRGNNGITKQRNQLIKDDILINNGKHLSFNKNYVFSSPSTAGGVVLGRSTNGWTKWKSKDGKTLDEVKRN